MTHEMIQELFSFDKWATNRTLESVAALSEEQFKRDLKSSHGGIHGTLVHLCGADWIWLERWKGNSPAGLMTAEQLPSLAILKEKWNSYRIETGLFLSTLDDNRLQAPLVYKDLKGNQHAELLVQQLLHKVNHGSYHRGQIVTMIRQLGGKPQNTDLIGYYRTIQH
jgi:uncharacterized damage-inducible protein DinB